MPEIKQPTSPAKKPSGVKAQKPDIRLSKRAIAGHKAGEKAPLEQLTKEHAEKGAKKSHKTGAAGKRKAGVGDEAMGVDAPLSGKGVKRRRPEGDEVTPDRELAGMASARVDRQKARKSRGKSRPVVGRVSDQDTRPTRRPRTLTRRRNVNTAAPRKENVALEVPCTIRSFSEATGVSSGLVLKTLMAQGVATLNINAQLDEELAESLAAELGVEVEFKQQANLEESLIDQLESQGDDDAGAKPRPPVVTFLGHVDHGKTSLLDYIIGTNVVAGEAGGITQHIRAYEITKNGKKIAFVDTPGHAAFTEMRARGANVTDIAVLVVAADDGVMPQTEEAISHAKAAGVPIVVALNKIDLPGANPDRVLQQLAAQELLPSEWGGDVEVMRTSATTGDGVGELLETILFTAEMHEYTANPDRKAIGVALEAEQEAGRGVIAKLIVQEGTLKVGDIILCGSAYGRVKAMYDTLKVRRRVKSAGPSTPVNVTGLDDAPEAGDKFYVLDDITQAREIAGVRADRSRAKSLAGISTKVSFEEFQRRLSDGDLADHREMVTLNLIVRTDVRGSIEAIEKELTKLEHPEVQVKILHKSVGAITAADVTLAHASQAVIIGFNVIPDEAARWLADEKQVEIRRYDVIYKVTDDIKALLEGKLKPEERVVELGHALVKRVFPISRVGTVAGCYVVRGSIARGCRVRVNRDGRTIGDYNLESLRHDKDDVKEVPRGMECGMRLAGFNDIKQDDILEAYTIEEVARTL
jgi:translation initiation factor IF-2